MIQTTRRVFASVSVVFAASSLDVMFEVSHHTRGGFRCVVSVRNWSCELEDGFV